MLYFLKKEFNHFIIIVHIMYVCTHTNALWQTFRSQKTTLCNWFFPLIFVWVLKIKLSFQAGSEAPLPTEPS